MPHGPASRAVVVPDSEGTVTIEQEYKALVEICLDFARARVGNDQTLEVMTANSVMEFLKKHHKEKFWMAWAGR